MCQWYNTTRGFVLTVTTSVPTWRFLVAWFTAQIWASSKQKLWHKIDLAQSLSNMLSLHTYDTHPVLERTSSYLNKSSGQQISSSIHSAFVRLCGKAGSSWLFVLTLSLGTQNKISLFCKLFHMSFRRVRSLYIANIPRFTVERWRM